MTEQSLLARSIKSILMAGVSSALLVATPALAQDESAQSEEEVAQGVEKKENVERVQVVGSRIRSDGLESATPIDVISADIAVEQGLDTLGDLLRTATVASGSNRCDECW
jgi:hypothetical protein